MTSQAAPIEETYALHEARLTGFCFRMLGDREAARDISQDVFLQACQSGKADPAWLYVCARSRCVDHLRRHSLWQRFLQGFKSPTTTSAGFEDQLADLDLGWSVLGRLPVKTRSLLLLRAYAGLSYDELAEALGTTPQSIAVMLHRARKRALDLMAKETLQ